MASHKMHLFHTVCVYPSYVSNIKKYNNNNNDLFHVCNIDGYSLQTCIICQINIINKKNILNIYSTILYTCEVNNLSYYYIIVGHV